MMRSRVRGQGQLDLFVGCQEGPEWLMLPVEERERTVELLARMLADYRRLSFEVVAGVEVCDE